MENNARILLILKYLHEETDAEHDVSSKDIICMLEANGYKTPDKRTIDSDINALISAG